MNLTHHAGGGKSIATAFHAGVVRALDHAVGEEVNGDASRSLSHIERHRIACITAFD